jgi:hypothetical protein
MLSNVYPVVSPRVMSLVRFVLRIRDQRLSYFSR